MGNLLQCCQKHVVAISTILSQTHSFSLSLSLAHTHAGAQQKIASRSFNPKKLSFRVYGLPIVSFATWRGLFH